MPGRVLVLGATGGIGRQVVIQALERGHEVTAFVRKPAGLPSKYQGLRLVTGSLPEDAAALDAAMPGQEAVISALGRGASFKSLNLMQRAVPVVLSAMRRHGVRRLIVTSAFGVGDTLPYAPFLPRLFVRTLLRDIYADKAAGEALVRQSDLDWTIVHPTGLTDRPFTGKYRAAERLDLRGFPTIGRADVAYFLLAQLADPRWL
ncbi:MAG TPA: NAD(P)-binding oxidoreductase, partial [Gemmatimonadales bacterium]|nr:NAD(P)-binding oxidoreductase [Gemmatimonadales bacterium]